MDEDPDEVFLIGQMLVNRSIIQHLEKAIPGFGSAICDDLKLIASSDGVGPLTAQFLEHQASVIRASDKEAADKAKPALRLIPGGIDADPKSDQPE